MLRWSSKSLPKFQENNKATDEEKIVAIMGVVACSLRSYEYVLSSLTREVSKCLA